MAVTLKMEEEQARSASLTSSASSTASAATTSVEAVNTATPPSVASVRRYDQATIERALALAAAMQEEHQATLTAEQVVRLGEEMNVDPAFVLKALSRLSAEERQAAQEVQEASKLVSSPLQTSMGFRRLPLTDRCAAVIVPAAMSLFAYFIFRETSLDNFYTPLFLFIAAPIFVIFLGVRLRSKRLGFFSGALLGMLSTVAVWLAMTDHSAYNDFSQFLLWTSIFSAAGAVLGGLTAIVTLHGARMSRCLGAALARYFPGLTENDA